MNPLQRCLAVLGFVLLILGGKFWFIGAAGSDLPMWDQWDGEGAMTLQPWIEGTLDARAIFHPHNEHRLITTKLYVLGLFAANGQWSAFVETTANAVVHVLSALLLLGLARRWLAGRWFIAFGALLALLFTLPFSWENTLFGFQVQFYLLLLFSLAQLALTLASDRFGWRWWLGQACGLLAVATMASGFLASVAVLAVLGHRLVRERRWTGQQWTTAALAAVFSVGGWLLKNNVASHDSLKARSPGEFARNLLELLAWPGVAAFPWALLLFVPAAVFIVRRLRSRTTSPDEAVQLGLLAWVLLQCAATAYARGSGGAALSSRYFDLLAVSVALGFVFLARETPRRFRVPLAAVWLAAVVAGLLHQSWQVRREFFEPGAVRRPHQLANVRAFLRTGDPAHLLNKPWGEVPYPDPEALVRRISPASIQHAMPPSVRRPVPLLAGSPAAPREVPAALPAAPDPVAVSTWTATARGANFFWRSARQPADTLPVLRFRVAGDLSADARGLRLVVKSAGGETVVAPAFAPGERWTVVDVFRPAGEWWIEAAASDPPGWFAFTEPIEVGRWSWFAGKVLAQHFSLMVAGAVLLLASGLASTRASSLAGAKARVARALPRWLLVAGFAFTIFGARLWLVDTAGSEVPTWDQWDAEGEFLLRPWLEGGFSVGDLFQHQNEHRIVVSKLFALGLFTANSQWDSFVEVVAGAAVHLLSALILLALGRRWLPRAWVPAYAVVLVLLFTLPFSWENSLFGFQCAFYFLLLFALGHIVLGLESDRFTLRWGLAQLCGLFALVTLASGFISSLAILAVLGYRLLRERRWTAQQIVTAALAVAFTVVGWKIRTYVRGHEVLKAQSAGQFLGGFLDLVAWPGTALFPWALLLFVPAVVFLVVRLRSKETAPDDAIQLGLVAWMVAQCLALAYGRSGGGAVLSSRYLDLLALNVALGFVFLVRQTSGLRRRIAVAVWLAVIVGGLVQQSRQMWRDYVAPTVLHQEQQAINVRAFLRTGDTAHLLNKPWADVPYPDPNVLVMRLASVAIQNVMPPAVRRPVAVAGPSAGLPREVPPGLPATTGEIAASTWKLPSTGGHFRWRSAMQSANALPVLRFRVAGDLGRPGKALRLAVRSAAGTVAVAPDSAPGERWKTVNVFRPAGEWWVEAEDDDPAAWFAFTQPVEVGRLTWLAEKMLKHHLAVQLGGLGLLAAGAVLLFRRRDERVA